MNDKTRKCIKNHFDLSKLKSVFLNPLNLR